MFLAIFCFWISACSESACSEYEKQREDSENQEAKEIIVVKIPPLYDKKLSPEENYWHFQHFLFPQVEIPNPIPKGLPNDDGLLYLSLENGGQLKLNSEDEGNISDTKFLTERLRTIFQNREKNGVYEPYNWKVVKAIGIRATSSTKYYDVLKAVDAVKQSGADPIVLLFDDALPNMRIVTPENNKATKQ